MSFLTKRKVSQGVEIITIDHLIRVLHEHASIWHVSPVGNGGALPASFVLSWQLRYALSELAKGKLYEVNYL